VSLVRSERFSKDMKRFNGRTKSLGVPHGACVKLWQGSQCNGNSISDVAPNSRKANSVTWMNVDSVELTCVNCDSNCKQIP